MFVVMGTDRLSAVDAAFLRIDRPEQRMHLGVAVVVDGPAPPLPELRELIGARAPDRLRRVARHRPLQRPVWQEVALEVTGHVRHRACGSAHGTSSDDRLQQAVVDAFVPPLPPDQPLWSADVVTGLDPTGADGRWALIVRAQHALLDGLGGLHALLDLLDPGPHGTGRHVTPPGTGRSSVTAPWRRRAAAVLNLGRTVAAPERTLSGPLSGHRSWRVVRGDLAAAKQLAQELDATVNDVLLALASGGLRDLLVSRGHDPTSQPVRSLVPVSLRSDDPAAPGNVLTGVVAALPVAEPDLFARVRAVTKELTGLKEQDAAAGALGVISAFDHLPEPVAGVTELGLSHLPRGWVGTATTNVPGPGHQLRLADRPVREMFPVVPIGQWMRLSIAWLSYDGALHSGITADAAHVPDIDVVADGMRQGWRMLS